MQAKPAVMDQGLEPALYITNIMGSWNASLILQGVTNAVTVKLNMPEVIYRGTGRVEICTTSVCLRL